MPGKFSVYSIDSEKAPPPFNDPENWDVKVVNDQNGLVVGLIVRSQENISSDVDEEVWAGFKYLEPSDIQSEFIKENLMPPMEWFAAYEGEESWREVLEKFTEA